MFLYVFARTPTGVLLSNWEKSLSFPPLPWEVANSSGLATCQTERPSGNSASRMGLHALRQRHGCAVKLATRTNKVGPDRSHRLDDACQAAGCSAKKISSVGDASFLSLNETWRSHAT